MTPSTAASGKGQWHGRVSSRHQVLSNRYKGIVCWLIDSDYDEETFFVRHAYFLGVNDPRKLLKTTCRAEINEEARAMLNSDNSRPFRPPSSVASQRR